ncbi:MAG: hypothetical protein C5B55_07915 [Blastocatellia bacterium]|nr:MAG: hypothetical protein C5B55_07915 [Blastocatellia bacterium]
MELVFVLLVVIILFTICAVVGHLLWEMAAWFFRQALTRHEPEVPTVRPLWECINCTSREPDEGMNCRRCGAVRPTAAKGELLKDLAATERQLSRFFKANKITIDVFDSLQFAIRQEQTELKESVVRRQQKPTVHEKPTAPPTSIARPTPIAAKVIATTPSIEAKPEPVFVAPKPIPRRTLSEVLNSFMEQSNIRWGEIIGGLLIIGCSTALVVSLWAQISQIPVLKFLIFTTVTAVLFGIGLYTEHRWKLPTTSRGILTIATLLVPLNFLAIAAVSSSTTGGFLVIASELLAPAIFLCLVYFAGRVITPGCAWMLSAGVLGSSVGQLLVRHFASPETTPAVLVFLGAFPVFSYTITVGLSLRKLLMDGKIDDTETGAAFTMLGTMSFAALLPFGLLLHKAGPIGMTMMYLAPIVTLWSLPMLATGTVLWKKIKTPELAATRTAATALAILGSCIAMAGMILAWPNPASIVPTALINVVVFATLAFALEIPAAHLIAATCFALAELVLFHVATGHCDWLNLRITSLLEVTLSAQSGAALAPVVLTLVGVSEWLSTRAKARDNTYYLSAAFGIAVISLLFFAQFGLWFDDGFIGPVLAVYSFTVFWLAFRRQVKQFGLIGAALLLFALAQKFAQSQAISFPWQTALFIHASICAIGAIASARSHKVRILSPMLSLAALASSFGASVLMFQANPWQTTSSQALRVFWLASIWLASLWLHRSKSLFAAAQIAITAGVILSVKATLQQLSWCDYLPHAFLHPWSLQIQGIALVLLTLAWTTLRLTIKHRDQKLLDDDLVQLLTTRYSIDRLVLWLLIPVFCLFTTYGSLSGVVKELFSVRTQGLNIANFPHQEVLGLGSWILVGLFVMTMLINLWDRRDGKYLIVLLAVLIPAIPLLAGRFEAQLTTASAIRWFSAILLLCGSVALAYRQKICQAIGSFGWPSIDGNARSLVAQLRMLLFGLTLGPMLALTAFGVIAATHSTSFGNLQSGIFSIFETYSSYSIPLVIVAIALLVSAVREQQNAFAIVAGLFFNCSATIAYILSVAANGAPFDGIALVQTVQLNAIVCSSYGIAWTVWRKSSAKPLLEFETICTVALNAGLIVPQTLAVFFGFAIGKAEPAIGDLLGLLSFGLNIVAAVLLARIQGKQLGAIHVATVLLAGCSLVALGVFEPTTSRSLQVMTVGTTLSAWLMLAGSRLRSSGVIQLNSNWQSVARACAAVLASIAVISSLRLLIELDVSRWMSVLPLLSCSVLFATLNWQTLQRRYLFVAAGLMNVAASVWWLWIATEDVTTLTSLTEINVIALSIPGIAWLLLELRARRSPGETQRQSQSVHDFAAIVSVSALVMLVATSFALVGPSLGDISVLTWLAIGSTFLLLIATLWDQRARYAVATIYLLGILTCFVTLKQMELPYTRFAWSAAMVLSIFALLSSLAWRLRTKILVLTNQLRIPKRIDPESDMPRWLVVFNVTSVAVVVAIAYWVELRFLSLSLRTTVALAVLAQSLTFGLVAQGSWCTRCQRTAIAIFIVGSIFLGWSWLTPGVDATWLNRSVIMMVETLAFTALYAFGLERLRNMASAWTNAARTCIPAFLSSGVLALLFCLATEVFYQLSFGAVRINSVSLAAIGTTLVISIVVGVLFAVSPIHDPLNLSDRSRMNYVYAAEVMLGLLFLHIRLTLPWLFTGFFEDYWPIVIMGIAYLGVLTSEGLRRRGLLTLSEPLARTGAFLPLLPVIGFWIAQSEIDYSLLLFIVGGLYGLLSILRRSFVFGAVAAVSGNAGLWYLLHRTSDYGFLQHPQLWLIPAALSVLLAAYLNEDRLTDDQMTSVRYLSLVTVYASSTADIFINGVDNSPWLPLVLGAFSLAGVFSGIVFRIRGLLVLGSVFLLLSIVTMIWYASANFGWTWLWYVAGIVTGATIIFMFAVFEKKRTEVLRMMEGLKEWER